MAEAMTVPRGGLVEALVIACSSSCMVNGLPLGAEGEEGLPAVIVLSKLICGMFTPPLNFGDPPEAVTVLEVPAAVDVSRGSPTNNALRRMATHY